MSRIRPSRLRKLRGLVWLGLPLALWWLARQLPALELGQTLSALSLTGLAALVAFNLCAMTFFSGRWWLILRALGYRLSYIALFRYRMSAFSISFLSTPSNEAFRLIPSGGISKSGSPGDASGAGCTARFSFDQVR